MKKIFFFLFVAFAFTQCDDDTNSSSCSTYATVKDLTGFDGCGFVFELEDGTRLEPLRIFICGTPPLPETSQEDPLIGFEFIDGKKVRIAYEETGNMSACMVGPVVKITCLQEIPVSTED